MGLVGLMGLYGDLTSGGYLLNGGRDYRGSIGVGVAIGLAEATSSPYQLPFLVTPHSPPQKICTKKVFDRI